MESMQPYQEQFVDFLVSCGALTFGDFTTKSGRKTPYFVNTGNFNSGDKISKLGEFYASHCVASGLVEGCSSIFGPSYKGIPLSVATSSALFAHFQRVIGYTFDRKEVKDHGDGGLLVGLPLKPGDRVIIVEDVITAGTTLKKIVPFLREQVHVEVGGVVISVDRCERGSAEISARQEAEQSLGIKVYPIVTIHQILQHLSKPSREGFTLSGELKGRIVAYLEEYGV